MKKFLLFLIISLTSLFIFNDSASAESNSYNIKQSEFEKIFYDKNNLTDSEKEKLNQAYQYFNVDFENDYYISFLYTSGNNKSVIIYKWDKSSTYIKPLSLGISLINNTSDKFLLYLNTNEENSYKEKYYHLYDDSIGTGAGYFHSKGLNLRGVNISETFQILETNSSILFTDTAYDDSSYQPYEYLNINNEDDDLCLKTFSNGDFIFDENGSPSWVEKTPTINISKTNEELTENNEKISETVNINFSIFDTEKYVYFYSTSEGEIKTWVDILENDYEYTSYSNGTLYLAVIDKAKYIESAENGEDLVFDYITTATYIFANIVDLVPDFRFETEIPDSCYLAIGGKQEIICKRVKIDILNYYDFEKYLVQYSKDGVNFTTLYTNQYTKIFTENVVLYFQILDRTTNKYIKYMTYTLSGISTNMTSIGPYIRLNGKYNEEKYLYEVIGYFYNYDSSLYNYYYSTDRENWTEIGQFELNIYSGADSSAIYYKTFEIYEDCTFYIKIEDKDGNYIYSTTMTIKMKEHGSNNLLNIFNNNADYDENIWSTLNNTYTKLRKSSIGTYIYLVIISSLIILIVKMFNR